MLFVFLGKFVVFSLFRLFFSFLVPFRPLCLSSFVALTWLWNGYGCVDSCRRQNETGLFLTSLGLGLFISRVRRPALFVQWFRGGASGSCLYCVVSLYFVRRFFCFALSPLE